MRERYIITVTDYLGSRHYTITQVMRRIVAGAGAVLGVIVLAGSLLIVGLSYKVSALNEEMAGLRDYQQSIRQKNRQLIDEQRQLQAAVQNKAEALSQMSDNLDQIEIMIGLKPEPEKPLHARLNTASLTAQQKRYMLESIPSGFPLKDPKITSGFGIRQHPVLHQKAMHGGVDMRAAQGTPVYATADGVVEWASFHKNSGLGKMVKLVHNYGFSSTYGHLNSVEVDVGDYVRRGELIGHTGNTGISSAPHLHYEVHYLYRRLDPRPFLEWSIDNYDVLFTREEHVKWDSLAKTVRNTTIAPERQWSPEVLTLSALSN